MRYFALILILFFWITNLNAQTISMSEFQDSKKTLSKINYDTDIKFGIFYYKPWRMFDDAFDTTSVEIKNKLTAFIGFKHYLGNKRKYNVELLITRRILHFNIRDIYYNELTNEDSFYDADIKLKSVIFTTNILRQSKITNNLKLEYGLNLGYALHNKLEFTIRDIYTDEAIEIEGLINNENYISNLSTGYKFGLIYFVNNSAFSIRYSSYLGLQPVNGYSFGFSYKL